VKPATDDERLCVELELAAQELSKHYSRTSKDRATLYRRAARRIRELQA